MTRRDVLYCAVRVDEYGYSWSNLTVILCGPSASALIQTTRASRQTQHAAYPITRETVSVMMITTTKGVSTMEVTAVPNLHRLQVTK